MWAEGEEEREEALVEGEKDSHTQAQRGCEGRVAALFRARAAVALDPG